MTWELALVVAAYLLGGVPSALIVVWMATGKDVRREGSGNVGAANATRVGGLWVGALVTLMDVAKAALPVWAMTVLNPASIWLAATMLAAVVGHCFPVWLRFRGGKGVAAAFGAFLVLAPWPTLAGLGVWLVVLVGWRWVSLASMVATASFPLLAVLIDRPNPVILGGMSVVAILIIARHGSNIRQLVSGTEPKIGGRGEA
jgi:glycerol-3-phosphate acyltransferase PlsY